MPVGDLEPEDLGSYSAGQTARGLAHAYTGGIGRGTVGEGGPCASQPNAFAHRAFHHSAAVAHSGLDS